MSDVLELTKALIRKPSITPHDAGCQDLIIDYLKDLNCRATSLSHGEVTNLWLEHGEGQPLLVFAGHTDVVPTGPLEKWKYPPFDPVIEGDYLYGRGAQDMKSAVAAMTVALKDFVVCHPKHKGRIALLITSAEEGHSYLDGTPKVIEYLQAKQDLITWCVVGEPSSSHQLGDLIRNGRRGSLKGYLTIHGTQGHVAYAHLADNPIHKALPALTELANKEWDKGNAYFPATSFQISNIHAGTGALNVIPQDLEVKISFRYSSQISYEQINEEFRTILDQYNLRYTLNWELSGKPFLTKPGALIKTVQAAIKSVMNIETELSTAGGTSDGRFIAPTGAEVVELGTCNDTIHMINERVKLDELEQLVKVYNNIMERLLR